MDLVELSQEQRDCLTADEYKQIQENAVRLKTGNGGDCIVSCECNAFELHGNIICKRSGFFGACFESAFKESSTRVVHLHEFVTSHFLWLILKYMYLSVPKAGFDLETYGPMSDGHFYGLMFELYRQADYLCVHDLTDAIIKELQNRLNDSAGTLFRLQRSPTDRMFKKAYKDPMKAAVVAYDKSNLYYDFYEPIRANLFLWIQHCYPILCRLGNDFDDYLREAPELSLTILKTMRNIESSKFISPGPEALCKFCGRLIWQEDAQACEVLQPKFLIMADRRGHVKYSCNRLSCCRRWYINNQQALQRRIGLLQSWVLP